MRARDGLAGMSAGRRRRHREDGTTMAGNVTVVTDDTFETEIINSSKPALVDFWAVWCGPCRMIAPHVEALAGEFADKAVIAKLDVDSNRNSAIKFGIQSIPTLLFFKGGKVVDRLVGGQYKKDDLKRRLEALL
jgi:thioredoxin 1